VFRSVTSGLCTVNGSIAVGWSTGMNGQTRPQLVKVCSSSACRYAAAVRRSRKGFPKASLLSVLTEVTDDACDCES
jgi:hypothetical protein